MRIYLVALRTQLRFTGEYNRLIDLADLLRKAGLEVKIISSQGRRFRVNKHRAEGFFAHLCDLFAIFRQVLRLGKNGCIFILMLPTPSFTIFADFIKFCTHKPVIVYFESQLADMSVKHLLDDLKHEISFYFFRLCFNNRIWARVSFFTAERYIVSSKFQARELFAVGVPPEKVAVIRNVVSLPVQANTGAGFRVDHNIPADIPVVCYLGHYFHVKGVDLLIKAFSTVKKEIPDALLAIAWSGLGNEAPIERLIKELKLGDSIYQVGKVQLLEFFKECDVLVLPYRYTFGTQMLPNTMVEAISVGIPLVTSGLPPITEIVNEKTGMLCAVRKVNAISRAIITLLQRREKAVTYRQNQTALFQSMFNSDRIVEQYLNLIKQVSNGN